MSARFELPCPVTVEETGDLCGKVVMIEATKAEPATMWYPGAPEEFEVIECECGHKDVIEEKYQDAVWEFIRDYEVSSAEYAAEAAYDAYKDARWEYMGVPMRGGRGSTRGDW